MTLIDALAEIMPRDGEWIGATALQRAFAGREWRVSPQDLAAGLVSLEECGVLEARERDGLTQWREAAAQEEESRA